MVETAINALSRVQKIYLQYPSVQQIYKTDERPFAYEYYHKLRSVIANKDLYVSGEIKKGILVVTNEVGEEQNIIPDIVIHEYGFVNQNKMAIEIKTSPKVSAREIFEDISRLISLSNNPLNYEHIIFIAGNCNLCQKINNARVYKDKIIKQIENNPCLVILNILPITDMANLAHPIGKSNVIQIVVE